MKKSVKERNANLTRKSGINAGKFGSVFERYGLVFVDFRYLGKRIRESSGLSATKENFKAVRGQLDRIGEKILADEFHFAEIFPNSKQSGEISKLERYQLSRKDRPQDVNCGFYMKKWYQNRVGSKRVQEVSMIKEESYIRLYLEPFFGGTTFGDLQLNLFDEFIIWVRDQQLRGSSVSNYTINQILSLFKRICHHASIVNAWGNDFNPFYGYKKLKQNDLEDRIHPLSIDEQKLLINTIDPFWKPFLTVAFLTGMRSSELWGLKLKDIDFHNRVIHVQRSITKNLKGQYVEGPTKNVYSRRDIDIKNDILWNAISDQKKTLESLDFEYFFCTKEGNLFHQSNYRSRYWIPALEKAELDYRSPKQTRHSFATNCLCFNENPFWIAKIMGHKDPEMVLKRYSRFVHNMSGVPDGAKITQAYSGLQVIRQTV